jgi:hypothetical protein
MARSKVVGSPENESCAAIHGADMGLIQYRKNWGFER